MSITVIKYGVTARLLHWVSAIVILWATISGFISTTLNVDEVFKQSIASFNVSITTIFIPLFLLRIIYRCVRGAPAYGNVLTESEAKIAKLMHVLMYLIVCVVLISGVLMMKKDASLFNMLTLPHLLKDVDAIHFFRNLHTFSTIALAACIGLHLLALLKHEINGKQILKRMI